MLLRLFMAVMAILSMFGGLVGFFLALFYAAGHHGMYANMLVFSSFVPLYAGIALMVGHSRLSDIHWTSLRKVPC